MAVDFREQWYDGKDYIETFTSGSTGSPKSIRLLKIDMLHSARATCLYFGITDQSLLVAPLSTDYIAGKMMFVRSIVAGCRLVLEAPSNRPLTEDYGQIDLLALVPSQVDWLLEHGYPSGIGAIIIGGAALSAERERTLIGKGYNAYATYGMTETCSHVALRRLGDDLFRSMPGIEFAVTDEGALVIESPSYSWGRLVTRDVVELVDSHSFRYLGRLDNVINSGGVKIHPEQVERELARYIDTPFYVVGIPDTKWGEVPQLVVEGETRTIDAPIDKLHRPKSVKFVPMLPRTSTGKIIRRGIIED